MTFETLKNQFKLGQVNKHNYIHEMHQVHQNLFRYPNLLKSSDVQKIEIDSTGIYFHIKHRALQYKGDPLKFYVDPKDERITPIETLNFDTYEHDDFAMIVRLLKPNQTILDIGGNIGFHSVSLGKEFPTSTFYAFEPIPKTFAQLKMNIEMNHMQNIHCYNFGFSNEEKDIPFFFYPEGSGNASAANLSERTDIEKVTCHVSTVDTFVQKNKLKVDFIKCDVEGAELFVFQGAKETIRTQRPIIFSEILRKWSQKFNYDPNEIFQFFSSLGYKSYTCSNNELKPFSQMTEQTLETNFFFIPS